MAELLSDVVLLRTCGIKRIEVICQLDNVSRTKVYGKAVTAICGNAKGCSQLNRPALTIQMVRQQKLVILSYNTIRIMLRSGPCTESIRRVALTEQQGVSKNRDVNNAT